MLLDYLLVTIALQALGCFHFPQKAAKIPHYTQGVSNLGAVLKIGLIIR